MNASMACKNLIIKKEIKDLPGLGQRDVSEIIECKSGYEYLGHIVISTGDLLDLYKCKSCGNIKMDKY